MIPESKCQHPGLTNLVQEGPNAVLEEWSNCLAKKTRLTARGRTWSSPPCSVGTSLILLDASLSKCQHSGMTNSVKEGPNAGLPC